MKNLIVSTLTLLVTACASAPKPASDPYLWLENSKDPKVMAWVEAHNAKSRQALEADPRAPKVAAEIRKILEAEDRIPMPRLVGDKVRNFWQDTKHVRGIWRETSLQDYRKAQPQWRTILDIDALNKQEHKSWVYHGGSCLPPAYDLCMISLSDAGRDESTWREFRVSTRRFVKNGFEVPLAKSSVAWLNKDTLFLGTDFGPDSLTDSGYPRQVRTWKRGTPLASARLIFEGKKSDVEDDGYSIINADGTHFIVNSNPTFFTEKNFLYIPNRPLQELPFPETAQFQGIFENFFLVKLRQDWTVAGQTFVRGSLLSLPVAALGEAQPLARLEVIYAPDTSSALSDVSQTRDRLELNILHDVIGEIRQVQRENGQWRTEKLALPGNGSVGFVSLDAFASRFFVDYESFTRPTTLYLIDKNGPEAVKRLPDRFRADDIVTDQFFATSKDGTKVPYFVVHKKNMPLNGENPTLLYGYGGFEISETPRYLAASGKVWLEKGGVFVEANIRGGGEYGPRWHEAALKEHRQRAYDDFAAVTEDLFARKITSPRRLGIQGGSNGGLLVGVAVTQHPSDYHAVICESALLDMLRYTKLPPGASWIGEYGDPDDPHMADVIAKYSPYQNIRSDVTYPKIFFHISTADDRVQPGHTRKTVARFEAMGHDVLMYENTEGGHGGAADLEQRVKKTTLEDIYLYQQLID